MATLDFPKPAPPAPLVARPRGGRLSMVDLEAGLKAIGDAEDRAGRDERARLSRVRKVLEAMAAENLAT